MIDRNKMIHTQVHFSRGGEPAYEFCKGLRAEKRDGRKTAAFNDGVAWREEHNAIVHEANPEGCGDGLAVNIRYTVK